MVKEAFDSQITEFTSDMKLLIEDAKKKITKHAKNHQEPNPKLNPTLKFIETSTTNLCINPLSHTNLRIAVREGIKAQQFLIEGIKHSKISHLNSLKLKAKLNKIMYKMNIAQVKYNP